MRHQSGRIVAAGWLALAALACGSPDPPATPPAATGARPDYVFLIVVDTLRGDRPGYAGYARDTTPFLDRTAARSAVYDAAYATSSNTLESVFGLLASTLPLGSDLYRQGVPAAALSIQKTYALNGWDTLAVVANPWLKFHQGFFSDGFRRTEFVNQERGESWGANTTDDVSAWVETFLDEEFDPARSTFFYIHYLDPHDVYLPPKDYGFHRGAAPDPRPYAHALSGEERVQDRLERDPDYRGRPQPHPTAADALPFLEAAYDGEIRYVDEHLKRLFASLEARGLLERSVIAITSDHGEEFLDHGLLKHGFHLFDETVRVPLLIHGPAFVRAGREPRPVSGVDLAPTLLSLSGIAPPASMQGRDLFAPDDGRPVLFASHFLNRDLRGMRWGRWKLIEDRHEGTRTVYDLDADPLERAPLAAGDPAERASIEGTFEAAVARFAIPGADERRLDPPEMDEETREQLKSLGYVR